METRAIAAPPRPTPDALKLLMEGSKVLAQVEHAGVRIHVPRLERTIINAEKEIKRLELELKQDEVYDIWRKEYGSDSNINSIEQLGHILYNKLNIKCTKFTETNRPSVSEKALQDIDNPFVKKLFDMKHLSKTVETFLKGIRRECIDGVVHPFYNLHTVVTFRSSSDRPNWQNLPKRDPRWSKLVRRCVIAREGNYLWELDFKGAEVCVTGDTLIETIDGALPINQLVGLIENKIPVHVYGYDLEKGRIAVSKVADAKLTRKDAEIWKVTLDNGKSIRTTPDHKFMLRDGTYKCLRDLVIGESLMPFYKTIKKQPWGTNYWKVYLNNGKSIMAHNLIALDIFNEDISLNKKVVHHWNGIGTDNSLHNIEVMSRDRHMSIHSKQGWENSKIDGDRDVSWRESDEGKAHMSRMQELSKEKVKSLGEEFSRRISEGMKARGGNVGANNPMYGKKQSEETKRKISEAKKGKKLKGVFWAKGKTKETDERIRRASEAKKGKTPWNKGKKGLQKGWNKGKKLSEEERKRISERVRARSKLREKCAICGKEVTSHGSHWSKAHGISIKEYRETYNHKVVSIEPAGFEDVYNLEVEGFHNYAVEAGIVIKNCTAAVITRDENLLSYVQDKSKDMHRDVAMDLFFLSKEQVSKTIRNAAKSWFTFAEFYGDYYKHCAKNLWETIDREGLLLADGTPLRQHLISKGMVDMGLCEDGVDTEPNTFEDHVRRVERIMWDERFPEYRDWKNNFYAEYQKNGYFITASGFLVQMGKGGPLTKNEATNSPVQGPSFHCLLWTLIRLQKWLNKNKMKSMIVGQIHDSMVGESPPDEIQAVLNEAYRIIKEDLPNHYKWLTVPMEIECECADPSTSWWDKREWKRNSEGVWGFE